VGIYAPDAASRLCSHRRRRLRITDDQKNGRPRWGAVFIIDAPVAISALAAGQLPLHESKNPAARSIDIIDAVISTATLTTLIYGLRVCFIVTAAIALIGGLFVFRFMPARNLTPAEIVRGQPATRDTRPTRYSFLSRFPSRTRSAVVSGPRKLRRAAIITALAGLSPRSTPLDGRSRIVHNLLGLIHGDCTGRLLGSPRQCAQRCLS
jgi:hypothetical protein